MKKAPTLRTLSFCDSCELSAACIDKGTIFKADAGQAVREITITAGMQPQTRLRSETPPFAYEIAEDYEVEEAAQPIWSCARKRALGWCAMVQTIAPKSNYL